MLDHRCDERCAAHHHEPGHDADHELRRPYGSGQSRPGRLGDERFLAPDGRDGHGRNREHQSPDRDRHTRGCPEQRPERPLRRGRCNDSGRPYVIEHHRPTETSERDRHANGHLLPDRAASQTAKRSTFRLQRARPKGRSAPTRQLERFVIPRSRVGVDLSHIELREGQQRALINAEWPGRWSRAIQVRVASGWIADQTRLIDWMGSESPTCSLGTARRLPADLVLELVPTSPHPTAPRCTGATLKRRPRTRPYPHASSRRSSLRTARPQ